MDHLQNISNFIQEIKILNDEIHKVDIENKKIIENFNNSINSINNNNLSVIKVINSSYYYIKNQLNLFVSFISQYNWFEDIIFKLVQINNYYENKLNINNNLLKKNKFINKYVSNVFKFCNYRDILELINKNFYSKDILDYDKLFAIENNFEKDFNDFTKNDIDNNIEHHDLSQLNSFENYKNNLSNENLNLEDSSKSSQENNEDFINNYSKIQNRYYKEIEEYIENLKKEKDSYDNNRELCFQIDQDINIMNELINIIQNRTKNNVLVLELENKKFNFIIHKNNKLHSYLSKFKFFNIDFNNYFNHKVPLFSEFIDKTDEYNKKFFDNFDKDTLIMNSFSELIINNSIPFSFQLSNIKSYFSFMYDFFNKDIFSELLNDFQEDKQILEDLKHIQQYVNKTFEFSELETKSLDILNIINKLVSNFELNIEFSNNTYIEKKKKFFENVTYKKCFFNEYKCILYNLFEKINNDYKLQINIHELDILSNINFYECYNTLQNIYSYLQEINKNKNDIFHNEYEKDIIEKDFESIHFNLLESNEKLEILLQKDVFENNSNIININSEILKYENRIKEIIEELENHDSIIENINEKNIEILSNITTSINNIINNNYI